MRNDDANDQRMSLNHSHPFEGADAHDEALLTAEYEPEHEALAALAAKWSAKAPSAERLAAFTRQLPSEHPIAEEHPIRPLRGSPERTPAVASGAQAPRGGGRLLAGLVAAVVVVSLLAATLLRLAPSRTGGHQTAQATTIAATATATPLTARLAEEPSQQPPNGSWVTVAQAQIIPAPSDANVVYQVTGADVKASHDGGATWHDVNLPSFSQEGLTAQYVNLGVADGNAQVVLITLTLLTGSPNPSDCPAGTKPPQHPNTSNLHGGILASGAYSCIANFASHDGGTSWTPMQLPSDVSYYPDAFNSSRIWQLGQTLYGVNAYIEGISVLHGSSLLVSHDVGVSWAYEVSTSPEATSEVCSILPSIGDGALYALTSQDCYGRTQVVTDHTIWRSTDDGATWTNVSTVSVLDMDFMGASPATDGHGIWLYQERWAGPTGLPTVWFSEDAGATWSQAPLLQQASGNVEWRSVFGALADGSVTVALIQQTYTQFTSPPAPATFYAWRPGDTAWRQITTSITAQYSNTDIGLSHGGAQQGIDTLWVTETSAGGAPYTQIAHKYSIR